MSMKLIFEDNLTIKKFYLTGGKVWLVKGNFFVLIIVLHLNNFTTLFL